VPINDSNDQNKGSSAPYAIKKAKKDTCYRCGKPGHFFFDCTAILCDYYELASHKSEDCPLLSATKPQIITHGYADEKLLFFECPATKSYRPKLESTRNGTITVSDGELSIPQVVSQLRRLVSSEDFQWEVSEVDHNVFKTTFPSKMELERMKIYGTFLVPNTNIKLTVDQCVPSVQPTYMLPEVWVYVTGIPPKRKGDFLAMWALGSLFVKLWMLIYHIPENMVCFVFSLGV
jgi:hypothetical protein